MIRVRAAAARNTRSVVWEKASKAVSVIRKVKSVIDPRPITEGAGVKLKRTIGTRALDYLDPFLLLDHFESQNESDYTAGFPLHPHRGIETVTYLLKGEVRHKDTLGSAGKIGAGDVQWMTAGRGILHEEMPQARPEGIQGFQLWVHLPAKLKMTQPHYQEFSVGRIPQVTRKDGSVIRIITGETDGVKGPVTGIAADPIYLDVSMPVHTTFTQSIERGHHAFVYVFEGEAAFGESASISYPALVVLDDGDAVQVVTQAKPVRFLLVSGKPLGEPVVRHGTFVMNTKEEIDQALHELKMGTFIAR